MYVFVAFGISLHNGYSLVTSGRKHFVEYRGIEVVIITILFCTSLHFPLFSFLQGGRKGGQNFPRSFLERGSRRDNTDNC